MNIKKILFLFIFGIILFGITNSCFALTYRDYYGHLDLYGSIFKTNDHGDGLVGAKFKVSDINSTFSYYAEDEGNGLYGLAYTGNNVPASNYRVDENVTYNMLFNMLPRQCQSDLNTFFSTGSTSHMNEYYYYRNSSLNTIEFVVPLFIEEVTAPEGYVRGEKIVYLVKATIYKDGGNYVLGFRTLLTDRYLKYNKNLDYNNDFIDYANGDDFVRDMVRCSNLDFHSNALDNTGITYTPIILFNEKGNVSLSINNYVNNSTKYTTTRGNTLNYRVVIKNTGSGISHNNVIVTNVPKELKYVSKSASNGGIYNRTNHTITWKVANIKPGETISFRYSATVPKDVPVGANFIGKSTITSQEIGEIQSRETTVSLISNPKTAAPIAVIVLLASMLGVVKVIKNHNKEKELEI